MSPDGAIFGPICMCAEEHLWPPFKFKFKVCVHVLPSQLETFSGSLQHCAASFSTVGPVFQAIRAKTPKFHSLYSYGALYHPLTNLNPFNQNIHKSEHL